MEDNADWYASVPRCFAAVLFFLILILPVIFQPGTKSGTRD
jgi:hypothetical protein